MIPNQAHKMSNGSIVRQAEVHKHATHDQSSHGGGRGGAPKLQPSSGSSNEPQNEGIIPDTDMKSASTKIDRQLKSAKEATGSDFPYKEEPKIKRAVDSAYKTGDVRRLHSLNRQYGEKANTLDLNIGSDNEGPFDKEDLKSYEKLIGATATALRAFSEFPEAEM